jgi:short-subunit dehydrogenase
LQTAAQTARRRDGTPASTIVADLTRREDCFRAAEQITESFGRLNVLVNCIGTSDRGLVRELSAERLHELMDLNVATTLQCTQAMLPLLEASRGSVVNIGSLAGKVGARYLGGYNAAKHALSGLTQQMRLEFRESGVHVGLVSPGPIRREDAGHRYADRTGESLPGRASAPGGGAKVKGLDPERVARAVLNCAEHRRCDVVLPGHLRILIAVGHAWPPLGDWLLLKFTS